VVIGKTQKSHYILNFVIFFVKKLIKLFNCGFRRFPPTSCCALLLNSKSTRHEWYEKSIIHAKCMTPHIVSFNGLF